MNSFAPAAVITAIAVATTTTGASNTNAHTATISTAITAAAVRQTAGARGARAAGEAAVQPLPSCPPPDGAFFLIAVAIPQGGAVESPPRRQGTPGLRLFLLFLPHSRERFSLRRGAPAAWCAGVVTPDNAGTKTVATGGGGRRRPRFRSHRRGGGGLACSSASSLVAPESPPLDPGDDGRAA